jgi:hypothetical protein
MTSLAREPLQIVEIDVDQCTLTYGTGDCTASGVAGTECFNTYFTCQDKGNFDKGTQTLKFSKNQRTGIKSEIIFPALQSVSTNPTRIALGKTDETLGSLGKRARVKVSFKDFSWSDSIVDPYVATRSYDPSLQGTFFGKLRARFPYYYGRALRVRNGYVGDDIASMPTRHYIITEWRGPDSSGTIQITAQDPLKLADAEFAQCPKPSIGRLGANISTGFTGEVEFSAAGAGTVYDATGKIAIGSEIIAYSSKTADTITISERATDGTEASSHSSGDTVQQCYVAQDAPIYTVIEELLSTYAAIPSAFLPVADWEDELNEWFPSIRLNRVVAKPTAVKTLLSQIADFGIVFWWDEVGQEIKVRANRPPGYNETVADITDDSNILEKTAVREDLDDQRLSRVLVWHGYVSAAETMTNGDNYKQLPLRIDVSAEGANEYDQIRELQIYLPWLGPNGDDTIAQAVGARMVDRYRDTPQRLTFFVDIKDRNATEVASLVKVTSNTLQDTFGVSAPTEMRVTQVEEVNPGTRLKLVAETYQFAGRYGFITENGRGDYGTATEAEKATGTYIVDESTLLFPDGTGPYLIF